MSQSSMGAKALTWTRRSLLASTGLVGGGLALGIGFAPNRLRMSDPSALGEDEVLLNTWVKLTPDDLITVLVPHGEMGQGAGTGLAQMLAEDMDADWETIRVVQAPVTETYTNSDLGRGYIVGEGAAIPAFMYRALDFTFLQLASRMVGQMTGGSTAIRLTGQYGMRRAGAAARDMLVQAAAARWEVSPASLSAAQGVITHAESGRRVRFGALASDAARYAPDLKPELKPSARYTIVGQPKPRLDIPSKVDGSAQFGLDVRVPGMRTAAIRHAPVFGAKVEAVRPGPAVEGSKELQLVELPSAVAVVGPTYWEASQALSQVEVDWKGGHEKTSSEALRSAQSGALEAEELDPVDEEGSLKDGFRGSKRIESELSVPYLAHANMEPINCTAWVRDERCDIWVGHQNPMFARNAAARALGFGPEQVTVHPQLMGGGFGRRGKLDYVLETVLIAEKVGVPVKVVWSREEDMTNDFYRPAVVSKLEGAVTGGRITALSHRYIDARSGMPDSERPFAFQYDVPHRSIRRALWESPVPVGTWRSVDFTQMGFFYETFMDRLAHAAGRDPLDFRLAHTTDPRRKAALERLAEVSEWKSPLPSGRARGLALVTSFESIVGHVVEASLTEDRKIRVHKVTSVVDCGRLINPNAGEAQVQGSVIYGLTAALLGEITMSKGEVQQSNFPNYDMLRLATAPEQTVFFMGSDHPPGGLGEPAVPPVAPALANALFALTGTPVTELPLTRSGYRA
ncbi:MAG: molybdopterin cofactor-binding domain-containing protein [Myxococcota bacterium]